MIASAGSKSDDNAKAIAVQEIIEDLGFWYHIKKYALPDLLVCVVLIFLKRTCSHLELLAILLILLKHQIHGCITF